MVISKTTAKRNRQHNYGCKKVAKVDGENVKYQVCAYPYGNSSGSKKDSFNMVIKLISNPSSLNLKAKYEFYFEDKNGKPYKCKGETDFEGLTVSSDIHLLSSDKFQEVMKEDQEIQFTISFTVVGEIKKSSNTNGIRKDFQYSLPKLLSTIPCIRDSKEYYFKGKKWQYHLEVKEDNSLWIYFQLLKIYRENFDAEFEVKAYDTHLGKGK
uniref:Uncharacterized protein n=1 Tax=Panagrolaimus davidi TaxID=227884 RepID=A0A914R1M1_9BILA